MKLNLYLQPRTGTDVALFQALASKLVAIGCLDETYLTQRCVGNDELKRFIAELDIQAASMLAA